MTPRREFQHRYHLFPRDVKPVHHLTDSRSRSGLSNTTETGVRVSRNTQAPLRLPGMLSTAGHCDQSRLAMICAPSLRIHCCVTAPGPGDRRMARLKCCCAWVGGSSLREFSPRPYARRSQIDIPPHPSENKVKCLRDPRPRAAAHATLIVEYGTRRRFISPLHDPAVRRKCPGRRFYSDRCRRSLQRPSRYRLPLDEDLPAVLRRPPARPRRIRSRPPSC